MSSARHVVRGGAAGVGVFAIALSAFAGPEGFEDADVLSDRESVSVEHVETRITAYEQSGRGYQSQAGPLEGPGSEALHVLQAQGELVIAQGKRLTHRLWVPVDVVTSASANASDSYYAPKPDVISRASAQNIASQVDYQLTVRSDDVTTWTGGVAFHHEENFLSWLLALEYERSFADDNATLSVAMNQVLDWFDEFSLGGKRFGRTSRSSTNLNLGFSQLLSATTLASVGYGLTLQRGELSNTWNSVPLLAGGRIREFLPRARERHAASLGFLQYLPWRAALKLGYRLYRDDWDATAHSFEAALHQRLGSSLVIGANYRYHQQTAVSFYTERALPNTPYATADSDLGKLSTHTLGADATLTFPTRSFGTLFLSCGYDRYFRSDELRVNVATWASGFHF